MLTYISYSINVLMGLIGLMFLYIAYALNKHHPNDAKKSIVELFLACSWCSFVWSGMYFTPLSLFWPVFLGIVSLFPVLICLINVCHGLHEKFKLDKKAGFRL